MTIDSKKARRDAALRFLQTVVVVDDDAYGDLPEVSESATLGDESFSQRADADVAPVEDEHSEDQQEFSTEAVVEGFADLGIYCAVLKPTPGQRQSDERRVGALAGRADIVILDWVLRPNPELHGTSDDIERTSVGFIRDIVVGDLKEGGRTRLICIYTGEIDAVGILDVVSSAIGEATSQSVIPDREGRRIDVGATRILILGKERGVPAQTIESVSTQDLPDRIVDEFTEFAVSGLLREVALESLSAVRDESHRLLRRFEGDLDPALISHRSATSPADADQFARNLVGSELASIILAADVSGALVDARINEYIDLTLGVGESQLYWNGFGKSAADAVTFERSITELALKNGIDSNQQIIGNGKKLAATVSRTSLLFSGTPDEIRSNSKRIDTKFSVLSAFARDAAYEGGASHPPRLQLGVVLEVESLASDTHETEPVIASQASRDRHRGDEPRRRDYWVCLQPLCDSVRLEQPTRFPMLRLDAAKDQFNYLIFADGAPLALKHAGSRLRDVALPRFTPSAESRTVRGEWNGADWLFVDADSVVFRWVGSLRLDKAHKVLHSVVNTAGRIGIDEFDFLRAAAP